MSVPEGTSSIWSTWAPRSCEPSRRPPSCSRLDRPNAARCGGQSSQSTLKPWLEGDETIWNHISGTIEWGSLILGWDKFLDKVGWSISAMSLWIASDINRQPFPAVGSTSPRPYPNIPNMAFQFTGDQPKVLFYGAKNWSPNRSNCAMAWGPPSYQRVHDVSLSHALGWDGGSQGAMAIWDGWHQQLKMVKISDNGGNMWKCYRLGDGTISSHSNHLFFDGHVVKEHDEESTISQVFSMFSHWKLLCLLQFFPCCWVLLSNPTALKRGHVAESLQNWRSWEAAVETAGGFSIPTLVIFVIPPAGQRSVCVCVCPRWFYMYPFYDFVGETTRNIAIDIC